MIREMAFLMCFALMGCDAAQTRDATVAEIGSEITLAPGARVSVADAQMTVRFIGVTEDSRCPVDATCVWAGEVRVQLEIVISGVASTVTLLEGESTAAKNYRVTLLRVEPRPAGGARIVADQYRATLKLDEG